MPRTKFGISHSGGTVMLACVRSAVVRGQRARPLQVACTRGVMCGMWQCRSGVLEGVAMTRLEFGLGYGQFAEGRSWEQVVGQMDDDQPAAAFQVGRQRQRAFTQTLAIPC
jgi:hypothetical protein